RKFDFLAQKSKIWQDKMLEKLKDNPIDHLQFDDLITTHHTKLKPLSVTVAVHPRSRLILHCEVSQIPAFGHLAKLSRKKYGKRISKHKEGLKNLFEKITPCIEKKALVESDMH